MENSKEEKGHNHGCCCCGHGGGRHILIRWILGIAVLVFVFWAGFKLGEIKMLIHGPGRGFHDMREHSYWMESQMKNRMFYMQGGNMIQGTAAGMMGSTTIGQ
jgi:hypothetical protein